MGASEGVPSSTTLNGVSTPKVGPPSCSTSSGSAVALGFVEGEAEAAPSRRATRESTPPMVVAARDRSLA